MLHRDHNHHDEMGQVRQNLPETDDYISPEVPFRIRAIYDHLQQMTLLESMTKLEIEDSDWEQAVLKVHPESHINMIREACEKIAEGQTTYDLKWDHYESRETYEAVKLSSQACLTAVRKVLDNSFERGYCITRPPGHHAHSDMIAGFCYINNVAVAAQYAADQGKKVLIFDWDIHHGDGTQNIFYESNSVMYMSLHRFDN